MKILHVVSVFFSLPYFIGEQFKYFKGKGYGMYVACSPSEYLEGYSNEQGFAYLETNINRKINFKEDIISIYRIMKFIRDNEIDIVVGHSPKGALLSMIAAKLTRVPKRVYFRHGLVYETSSGIKRKMLIWIDRITSFCATDIVCVSQSLLEKSINDKLALREKQLILARGTCGGIDAMNKYNPCMVDKLELDRLRTKYGIENNDFVIGYTGRLVKDKGIVELVEAFNILRRTYNCKLLLVGPFEERDSLPDVIKEEIMSAENIIYTGYITDSLPAFYSLMSVYVLPSYREGFPIGILEAQSMGIPALTTRATGCIDSIIEGKTGLFISHEPLDIANKIKLIIDSPGVFNGRDWVVNNFDYSIVWKDIEKLYLSKK